MSGQDFEQLTLFPAGSPASRSVWPGSEEARQMTVTSGRKCCELFQSSSPLGLLEKMLLESSIWRSTRCYLTWQVKGTPQGRLLFRLAPSTPRTGGTDARLLRAPTIWPTPSASDTGRTALNPILTKNGTIRHQNRQGGQSFARLDQVAALFPTPRARESGDYQYSRGNHDKPVLTLSGYAKMYATPVARDHRTGTGQQYPRSRNLSDQVATEGHGGRLNPTWVEWLMGLPIGWTDLDA